MKTLEDILLNPKLSEEEITILNRVNLEIILWIKYLRTTKKTSTRKTFSEDLRNITYSAMNKKSKSVKELLKFYGLEGACGRGIIGDLYSDDWHNQPVHTPFPLAGVKLRPRSKILKMIGKKYNKEDFYL